MPGNIVATARPNDCTIVIAVVVIVAVVVIIMVHIVALI